MVGEHVCLQLTECQTLICLYDTERGNLYRMLVLNLESAVEGSDAFQCQFPKASATSVFLFSIPIHVASAIISGPAVSFLGQVIQITREVQKSKTPQNPVVARKIHRFLAINWDVS